MGSGAPIHVSRHFLDRQAQHVRFVPFAAGGPVEDAPGTMMTHNLFVTGGWRQEFKVVKLPSHYERGSVMLDHLPTAYHTAATYGEHRRSGAYFRTISRKGAECQQTKSDRLYPSRQSNSTAGLSAFTE